MDCVREVLYDLCRSCMFGVLQVHDAYRFNEY